MGTVPIGTGDAAMIARRMPSMFPPVDRSITVSAPYLTAILSFSISPFASDDTCELPMLALIFTRATLPIAIGSSAPARWWILAGVVQRPAPRSFRRQPLGQPSPRGAEAHADVVLHASAVGTM